MTRLNRYLSSCGLGSRRGCEDLITSGKVRVNGQLVTSLATKVNIGDEVSVRGQKLAPQKTLLVALHKPKGYVCTRSDEHDRKTIYDLLPREYQTLHHIGRLDMDSSGLILLTNDGALSHRLTHPSKGIEKEYEVTVEELMDENVPAKLVKGMMTPEGFAKAERAWLYGGYKIGIVLKQGLKRQIRHMLYNLGHEVRHLVRVRIGGYHLKGMTLGSWRELPEKEAAKLLQDAVKEESAPRKKARPKIPSSENAKTGPGLRERRDEVVEKARRAFKPRQNEDRASRAETEDEFHSPAQEKNDADRPRRGFKSRGKSPVRQDTTERSSRLNDKPKRKPKGTRHGGQRTPLSSGKRSAVKKRGQK